METQQQPKVTALMALGFVVLVIVLVWSAVQLVNILPGAFGSLASIAESINSYRPVKALNLRTDHSVINSGQAFSIAWDKPRQDGITIFEYDCTEDITVTVGDDLIDLSCTEEYVIKADNTLEVNVTTEQQRFVDVTYQISFTSEQGETVTESNTITIVNAHITTPEATEDEEPTAANEDDGGTGDTGGTEPTTPAVQYRTVQTPIYKIPVSDPNGYTELSASYIGVGKMIGNTFIKTDYLERDKVGAIRFAVKNLGTKTSDTWTFRAELPTGQTYRSAIQVPLKPNEETILTISFDGIERTGTETFAVTIETNRDISSTNNQIKTNVTIVR